MRKNRMSDKREDFDIFSLAKHIKQSHGRYIFKKWAKCNL